MAGRDGLAGIVGWANAPQSASIRPEQSKDG
jgi:hypothetical protein